MASTGKKAEKMTKKSRNVGVSIRHRNGKWYGRVQWIDDTGKRHDKLRGPFDTKSDARRASTKLRDDLQSKGSQAFVADKVTFAQLADYYEQHHLTEAHYAQGRKVAGLRSVKTPKAQLKVLRVHFGKKLLTAITYGDCKAYRDKRFKTPTRTDIARHVRERKENPNSELRATRAIASVNRELALLRAMLNTAVHQQWITRNPFNAGAPLINAANEEKREVVLSRDEERRLLDACDERMRTFKRNGKDVTVRDARRVHLKGFLIALLDTGCRRGELLKLVWDDVDFDAGVLHIRAFNTKTQRERAVPMSTRLRGELAKRYEASPKTGTVFGLTDVKKSFDAARKDAGLEHVRLHDIRHTAATRLVQQGVPLAGVSRHLGHTNVQTTYRYVNADTSSLELIRNVLDNPAWAGAEQPVNDADGRVN